jgi:hypothetical protein
MTMRPYSLKAQFAAAGILAAAAVVGVSGAAFSAQTGTITLSASVAQNCSITTAADSSLATALSSALTGSGTQTVTIGTVSQACNKKAGYTLTVSSASCLTTAVGSVTAPTGAKLINSATGVEEYQPYSVAFTNPSGSNATNLLASTCSAQIGRDVSGKKISNDSSTLAISFTPGVNGVNGDVAGAGTFTDTLTIDMSVR